MDTTSHPQLHPYPTLTSSCSSPPLSLMTPIRQPTQHLQGLHTQGQLWGQKAPWGGFSCGYGGVGWDGTGRDSLRSTEMAPAPVASLPGAPLRSLLGKSTEQTQPGQVHARIRETQMSGWLFLSKKARSCRDMPHIGGGGQMEKGNMLFKCWNENKWI